MYFVWFFIIRGLDKGRNPEAEYLEYDKIILIFNLSSWALRAVIFFRNILQYGVQLTESSRKETSVR